MKKILLICALALIYSCNKVDAEKQRFSRIINKEMVDIGDRPYHLIEIEYKGHVYLLLNGYRESGVTHAEHCSNDKCRRTNADTHR